MRFPLCRHRKAKLSHVTDVFFYNPINKAFTIRVRILEAKEVLFEDRVQGINFFRFISSHGAV